MSRAFLVLILPTICCAKLAAQENPVSVADSLHELGKSYYFSQEYSKAVEVYEQALKIKQEHLPEFDESIQKTAFNLATNHYQLSNYYQTIQYLQLALRIRTYHHGYWDQRVATYHSVLGSSSFQIGLFREAHSHFQEAEKIYLRLLETDETIPFRLSGVWNNLAVYCMEIGDYQQAEAYLRKTEKRWEEEDNEWEKGLVQYNLGELYRQRGDLARSLLAYQAARQIWETNDGHNKLYWMANCLERIGITLIAKAPENREEAIGYMKQGLALRIRHFPEHGETYAAYHNLGLALKKAGELPEAKEYLQKALDLILKAEPVDSFKMATVSTELGHVEFEEGGFEQADSLYAQALSLKKKHLPPGAVGIGQGYAYLAEARLKQGNAVEARTLIEEALRQLTEFAPAPFDDFSNLRNIAPIAEALVVRASVTNSPGRAGGEETLSLKKTLYDLRLASRLFDQVRVNHYAAEDKLGVLQSVRPVYEQAIEICLKLHQATSEKRYLEEAFQFSEKSRSASLHENWIKRHTKFENKALAAIGVEEERHRKRMASLENRLFEARQKTPEVAGRLEEDFRESQRAYYSWIDSVKEVLPEYYAVNYQTEVVSPEKLQRSAINANQALLEYFVGENAIYLFVLRQDTMDVKVIPKNAGLDERIGLLKEGIYDFYAGNTDGSDGTYDQLLDQYSATALDFYRQLITPAESLLKERLVIIPDGSLAFLPFEALLVSAPEEKYSFEKYDYLMGSHSISYNYSATLWEAMARKKLRNPGGPVLSLAPYYFGGEEKLKEEMEQRPVPGIIQRDSLGPLAQSGREAFFIARLWNGSCLLGKKAQAKALLEMAGKYRILHLATHAEDNEQEGEHARIYFYGNEPVYVRDIYNLKLDAEMVVLSACETGAGELQPGEGVISLARAFIYAGSKSVVNSLWKTNDGAASLVMKIFYSQLFHGQTKDEALRQAKKKYMAEYPGETAHPFFWAGFIGMGDMKAISF
ncbi:MAG: CHAT domain-containing protein [Phaeodactylibacter sp.]|nr:CHAT domain-containing protein [Phaeodactylibacter sp.]